jgi:hypothetical protein
MRALRRSLGALTLAACVSAAAAPIAAASPLVKPLPLPAGAALPGQQAASGPCFGTNRPSLGGNSGSTSVASCGKPIAFAGPAIGQIAAVIGPTIIGGRITEPIITSPPG